MKMSATNRIFKENAINRDDGNVSTVDDAMTIYHQYYARGYSVRIDDVETGADDGDERRTTCASSILEGGTASMIGGPRQHLIPRRSAFRLEVPS